MTIKSAEIEHAHDIWLLADTALSSAWSENELARDIVDSSNRAHLLIACRADDTEITRIPSNTTMIGNANHTNDSDYAHTQFQNCNEATIAGFIHWWEVAGEAEIHNVVVDADFRGIGIGWQMLQTALDDISARSDISSVFLEVRASNVNAIRLYESHGFVEIARRKRYYHNPNEDAIVMKMTLQKS
ncbi:MAG: ribosomal protein S18-alanine N-acetyltransferase [Clostridiales Family XIII bacterium]|jgi:ribosomal-protein-alanine acetyltransferase|nr:ribosomal protein S18-alanine N-acetyltransferase [Clostridiales Family XIII bacterium]